jgi:hypothetical protein
MMKGYRRLNHRLQEKFLARPRFVHPARLPSIMRRMKLARVVKINPRQIIVWIRGGMLRRVSRISALCHFSHYTNQTVKDERGTMNKKTSSFHSSFRVHPSSLLFQSFFNNSSSMR